MDSSVTKGQTDTSGRAPSTVPASQTSFIDYVVSRGGPRIVRYSQTNSLALQRQLHEMIHHVAPGKRGLLCRVLHRDGWRTVQVEWTHAIMSAMEALVGRAMRDISPCHFGVRDGKDEVQFVFNLEADWTTSPPDKKECSVQFTPPEIVKHYATLYADGYLPSTKDDRSTPAACTLGSQPHAPVMQTTSTHPTPAPEILRTLGTDPSIEALPLLGNTSFADAASFAGPSASMTALPPLLPGSFATLSVGVERNQIPTETSLPITDEVVVNFTVAHLSFILGRLIAFVFHHDPHHLQYERDPDAVFRWLWHMASQDHMNNSSTLSEHNELTKLIDTLCRLNPRDRPQTWQAVKELVTERLAQIAFLDGSEIQQLLLPIQKQCKNLFHEFRSQKDDVLDDMISSLETSVDKNRAILAVTSSKRSLTGDMISFIVSGSNARQWAQHIGCVCVESNIDVLMRTMSDSWLAVDEAGRTALHFAMDAGNVAFIAAWVRRTRAAGRSMDTLAVRQEFARPDNYGLTPLQYAHRGGHTMLSRYVAIVAGVPVEPSWPPDERHFETWSVVELARGFTHVTACTMRGLATTLILSTPVDDDDDDDDDAAVLSPRWLLGALVAGRCLPPPEEEIVADTGVRAAMRLSKALRRSAALADEGQQISVLKSCFALARVHPDAA